MSTALLVDVESTGALADGVATPAELPSQSFLRSLPRAMIGFLFAVMADCLVMIAYAILLLATGTNISSQYFAGVVITAAISLVYFAISAIRTENTIELVTAIAVGTSVTVTIYYVRLGFGSIQNVQRSYTFGVEGVPQGTLNTLALTWQSGVQLALLLFGYLSYNDFGWRIFKLFGTDLQMRRLYERFLWFKAVLKLDAILAGLNVGAGVAFFFRYLTRGEMPLMLTAIAFNLIWDAACFIAVKFERRTLAGLLLPCGLLLPGPHFDESNLPSMGACLPNEVTLWLHLVTRCLGRVAGYLIYRGYDLYREEYILHSSKYDDVWEMPINATIVLSVAVRLILLVLIVQTRRSFGKGLKGFSMATTYELPQRLRDALSPQHASGIKSLVRG